MTVEDIKSKLDQLFSDTSVPASTTRDRLEDIAEHIESLLETLGDDD